MKLHVVAAGQDRYWLTAVRKALTGSIEEVELFRCSRDLQRCIPRLPCPDRNSILLVDASGQGEVEKAVENLRNGGWRYVIVVAADPSAKEATAVLRRNLGYDYWEKTYEESDIRGRVHECFDEIERENLANKVKRRRVSNPRQKFE